MGVYLRINNNMDVYITESNGVRKKIGTLKDGVYRKKVKGSIHLFRKLDAWGVDAEFFNNDLKDKANDIRILDTEEQTIYSVKVKYMEMHGQYLHFKPHRAQFFLPRKYWKKEKRV